MIRSPMNHSAKAIATAELTDFIETLPQKVLIPLFQKGEQVYREDKRNE